MHYSPHAPHLRMPLLPGHSYESRFLQGLKIQPFTLARTETREQDCIKYERET